MPAALSGGYHASVRVLGIDLGRRRIGFAVSDPTGVLARPLEVVEAAGPGQLDRVVAVVTRLSAEADGLDAIVVGLPRRLDGTPTDLTDSVASFAEALVRRVAQPVHLQDERLSSVEAESRLALGDRDWRSRKRKLDAAAAAVILQDYLDVRR